MSTNRNQYSYGSGHVNFIDRRRFEANTDLYYSLPLYPIVHPNDRQYSMNQQLYYRSWNQNYNALPPNVVFAISPPMQPSQEPVICPLNHIPVDVCPACRIIGNFITEFRSYIPAGNYSNYSEPLTVARAAEVIEPVHDVVYSPNGDIPRDAIPIGLCPYHPNCTLYGRPRAWQIQIDDDDVISTSEVIDLTNSN